MSQIFPETVAASSNGTPCFSKLLMAFRMSQENIYCIYTNRDCFDSFKSSHRLQAGGADVARGGGVAASGTLAERKAAHLSLRGCDRVSTRCNRAGDTAWVPRCSAGRTAGSAGLRRRNAQLRWAMRGQDPQLCRSPRLDTSCERRVIVRNFLLKYVEFSHMTRFRCMKTFGWVGILLLGVFVTRVASAAPAITPDSGPIGIAVTITGEGFGKFVSTRDNAVLFGKNKAPGLVEQWEDGRIIVRVPHKAVTGPVVVKAGKKTKPAGTFTVEVPTVREVSPKEAAPGAQVQIIGRNFGPSMGMKDTLMPFGVSEVQFNGVAAEVVQWRDTRIEVKVPSNAITGPLAVRVASMDPLPDGSCCAPVQYSTTAPVTFKVMTSITLEPTEGPMGSPVVISGRGFGPRKPGQEPVPFT